MDAGALGAEIVISGKVPGARAKSWRFMDGYLKKCGDIAVSQVIHGLAVAITKTGSIGIKVRIMPPTIELPDKITLEIEKEPIVEEIKEEKKEVEEKKEEPIKEEKKEEKPKKKVKKTKKSTKKKVENESKRPSKGK